MGFSRQEYWSGLPFPSPGDLLDPGIELSSPTLAGRFCATWEAGDESYFVFNPSSAAFIELASRLYLCISFSRSGPEIGQIQIGFD